ncbi:MAG: site-specific DNA-methyltransferase [Patescibacteria group bacterium]
MDLAKNIIKKNISELIPDPENPRFITEDSLEGLKTSIQTFGYVEPIVWNKCTGHVVGGHQRLKALQSLGEKEVDVLTVDLSEKDERKLNITLNNRAIQGEWDIPKLETILTELEDCPDFQELRLDSLKEICSESEVKITEEKNDLEISEDFLESAHKKWSVKKGQIWHLGEHRLLCGDSTDKNAIERLCGDDKANLMVTDPPYGVNYDPAWRESHDLGVGKRSKGKVKNDDIVDWSEMYKNVDAQVLYVWHAAKFAAEVAKNLIACGYEIISQIIWVKQHFVLSRGDYHWRHEPCWYAAKKGRNHNWNGARDQDTIWEIQNNNSFGHSGDEGIEKTVGHGTQKPIECMARPIRNNSKPGDYIIDPFCGSGTTIVACERLKRKCLAIEIDEKYCSAILERYNEEVDGKEKIVLF